MQKLGGFALIGGLLFLVVCSEESRSPSVAAQARVVYEQGQQSVKAGDYTAAIRAFRTALQVAPSFLEAHSALATALES